jgi:hypothetical protein
MGGGVPMSGRKGVMGSPMPTISEVLTERVVRDPDTGCWEWLGARDAKGYSRVHKRAGSGQTSAHKLIWEHRNGSVPIGLELDHLCLNKLCVNPDHLEAVTHAENIRRAYTRITHCPAGHEYTAENTARYEGRRKCRQCLRDRSAARRRAA